MDTIFEALGLAEPVIVSAPPSSTFSVYDALRSRCKTNPAYVCQRNRSAAAMLRALSELRKPVHPYGHSLTCYDINNPPSGEGVRVITFYELHTVMIELEKRLKSCSLLSHKRVVLISGCIEDEAGVVHEVHARHSPRQTGWDLNALPMGSVIPGISVYRFVRQSQSVHV